MIKGEDVEVETSSPFMIATLKIYSIFTNIIMSFSKSHAIVDNTLVLFKMYARI